MTNNLTKHIVVVGYSGHGFVVTEAAIASGLPVHHYAEKSLKELNPFELEYLGYEGDDDFKGWQKDYSFILGVGNNKRREETARLIERHEKELLRVIHPAAGLADKIELGKGVFVAMNVSVNPLAQIGDYTILNTGCIVEHECVIGTASHIAPGAVLAGNVEVGNRCFVGANTVIKQGVKIGDDAIIGAGAVVIRDAPSGKTVVGNPGRIQ